jgi:tryptophanyl-tRNA synthetase
MKRIVSGIQTSGILHLGNYLGAIKNWKNLQQNKNNECLFFLADNHSITLRFMRQLESEANPEPNLNDNNISELTMKTAACLLACGLDAKTSPIFVQSQILEHSELMWILSCMTPPSWLNKMIQYKEKSKNGKVGTTGLYTYPILMAADILLYKANEVPVGEDQVQHIEVTRDIALRLNKLCKQEIIPIPNYVIPENSSRIMSLSNGKTKMSKSDQDGLSCISLIDTEEAIKHKIFKARTDSIPSIYYDMENRPEVSNLLNIYATIQGIPMDKALKKLEGGNMLDFKNTLIQTLIKEIVPISLKANKLMSHDREYIKQVLNDGRQRAQDIAKTNLTEIKRSLSYLV